MPLLDLRIRWAESSDSQIRLYPVRSWNSGLNKKTDRFIRWISKNLNLVNGAQRNQPYFDVLKWRYRVDVPILPKCRVSDWCTEFREVSGTSIDVVPIPVQNPVQGADVHTGTGGTDIDVPNVPKCPVPVLVYQTYRSVRYRYVLMLYRRTRY